MHWSGDRNTNKLATENSSLLYLDNEGTKDNTTEDKVVEDAFKDIPFTVDLAGIDLVEKLHQYKSIEDNGVVFRRRGVEGCIPAAVNVKHFLPYRTVRERSCYDKQRDLPSECTKNT